MYTDEQKDGGREGERAQFTALPHAVRTPPWGDSDFKPLPCFIFPWLLQPDQSSQLPSVTQPSSVQPGPQSPPHRMQFQEEWRLVSGKFVNAPLVYQYWKQTFERDYISVFLHVLANYYNSHVLYITVSCSQSMLHCFRFRSIIHHHVHCVCFYFLFVKVNLLFPGNAIMSADAFEKPALHYHTNLTSFRIMRTRCSLQ